MNEYNHIFAKIEELREKLHEAYREGIVDDAVIHISRQLDELIVRVMALNGAEHENPTDD